MLTQEKVIQNLKNSLNIIHKYNWLLDSYILDFYVHSHWFTKLSESWRITLDKVDPEELSDLLEEDENGNNYSRSSCCWPLELLALKKVLQQLCISRKQNRVMVVTQNELLEHSKLRHMFSKGVKAKKRHEILQIASVCQRSCIDSAVDFLVDFGAGLGHLARVLGYGFGIRVCCLEMQSQLNKQARILDARFEETAKKYLKSEVTNSFRRPTHVDLCLSAEMQPSEFLRRIKEALNLQSDNFRFGIIGLHPCGDLGVILMRMYLNCSQAKFLNFVGCCYMKLTTKDTQPQKMQHGYPLSNYLRTQLYSIPSNLSYEAREISCHAIEMFNDRLRSKNYANLKVHSYRAAAERIIVDNWPKLRHSGLKSVKDTPNITFKDYYYKAVEGLGSAAQLQWSDVNLNVTASDLFHWKRIVIFYTLRLMLAPLVESIIHYDRMLFLLENDCQVDINAIFDPRISSRNHLISAVKRS